MDISFTVSFFVSLFVCTVTDFSGKDKANGVKFCMVAHGRPGQGISHFCELCSPRSPKSDESATHRKVKFRVGRRTAIACLLSLHGVWASHRHVWIYGRPRRRTYLLSCSLVWRIPSAAKHDKTEIETQQRMLRIDIMEKKSCD